MTLCFAPAFTADTDSDPKKVARELERKGHVVWSVPMDMLMSK